MDLNIVKAEKSRAMRRFNRLRRIARLFRFVELCVLLVLLSCWISSRIPFAVKISGDFIRWLAGVAVSPLFVFAVGNAIIVTLMAKSGKFSVKDSNAAEGDCLFESLRSGGQDESESDSSSLMDLEPVYEDKEMIFLQKQQEDSAKVEPDSKLSTSQSESTQTETVEKFRTGKTLQRSETDVVCLRKACREEDEGEGFPESEEELDEKVFPEDGMSSEEFRRTIEAFIAKQKKFRREESQTVVLLHGQA